MKPVIAETPSSSAPLVHIHTRIVPLAALVGLMMVLGGMLVFLSVARYVGHNAGMLDLGHMSQAIASVRRGEPLVFTYLQGPMSRLALHVEWFYLLLAPLFALWPDPRSLLVAQALLFTAGAWPAYRLGARRLASAWAGVLLAAIYLLYPVAATAVLFDIHGDTFALPLLMFALEALDRRAWRSYGLWLALALSCKFYVAVPLAMLGLVIWIVSGQRRVGLITTAVAILYALFAFFVVRPAFTTATTSAAHRGLNYLSFYFGQFQEILTTLDQRLLSALIVFGPALFLAWRAWPWLLPALPLAFVALISTGPGGGFDYRSHHYAIVVPFLVLAVVYAADSLRSRTGALPKRNWRADLAMTALIVTIAHAAFVDSLLNPLSYLRLPGRGLDSSMYGVTARDAVMDGFLAEYVRPDDKLMASMFLAAHAVDRPVLYAVRYPQDAGGELLSDLLPRVDTVVADALFDYRIPLGSSFAGGVAYERQEIARLLRDPDFGLLAMRDGLLLFRRDASDKQRLPQRITTITSHSLPELNIDFGPNRLIAARLMPLGARRWQVDLVWQRSTMPLPEAPLIAVSRLEGVPNLRIVHLPSFALLQPQEWPDNAMVHEQFVIALPDDLPAGTYRWKLAWYNSGHSEAYTTDARSRVGIEAEVFRIDVSATNDSSLQP
jgi:uncharacterized membrane protein